MLPILVQAAITPSHNTFRVHVKLLSLVVFLLASDLVLGGAAMIWLRGAGWSTLALLAYEVLIPIRDTYSSFSRCWLLESQFTRC